MVLKVFEIKKIGCSNFLGTYASTMASEIDVKVQAALPATYSEITPNFHISSLTKENVKFFKTHLNISLGELEYGIYDKTTVDRITTIFYS
jgi:hypothetical protein